MDSSADVIGASTGPQLERTLHHIAAKHTGAHFLCSSDLQSPTYSSSSGFVYWLLSTKYGIPVFVMNFMVPQENPLGRMLPRYDLRNVAFLLSK
jgi:hypothetical protein